MNAHNQWYPVSLVKKMSKKPQRFVLQGQAIVVYKNKSGWVAQKDSCPHRNYPLSTGKLINGKIQCGYHGWQFDHKGFINHIPGLTQKYNAKTCSLTTYSTQVYEDLLWVCLKTEAPFHIQARPLFPGRKIFSYRTTIAGDTADILENFLDPMHTSILHDGLIRSSAKPRKTKAEIRAIDHGVEVKYTEESHQSGIIGNLFGRLITHSYGRLTLGNIIDLEFYSKRGIEMTNRFIIVPTKPGENYFFSQITASNRWFPARLKVLALTPFLLLALRQDKKAIKAQYDNHQRFAPDYKSTYLDIMRPYIDQMLKGEALKVIEKDIELYT